MASGVNSHYSTRCNCDLYQKDSGHSPRTGNLQRHHVALVSDSDDENELINRIADRFAKEMEGDFDENKPPILKVTIDPSIKQSKVIKTRAQSF